MTKIKECKERDKWLARTIVELNDPNFELIDICGSIEPGDMPWIVVGVLNNKRFVDYLLTFQGRIRCIWNALRGRLWGYNMEFYHRDDVDRFLEALAEMRDKVWSKSDGG